MQLVQDAERSIRVRHRGGLGDLDGHPARIHPRPEDRVHDPIHDVVLPQLSRRQVEGDVDIEPLLPPLPPCRQTSSITQAPIASIRPISSASGMKSPGGTRPPFGSGQRISASTPGHLGVPQVDERLVVEHPLLLLDRAPETGRHRQPDDRLRVVLRVQHVSAGARALRPEHRGLRVLEQRRRIVGIVRERADPHAGGHVELRVADGERGAERLLDPEGHRLRGDGHALVPAVARRCRVEVREEEEELVPARSRHEVGLPCRVAEPLRELHEDRVPGLVAEGVVDQLEVVEVHRDDDDAEPVPLRPREGQTEELVEHRPVRESRELVVVREERDPLLGDLAAR